MPRRLVLALAASVLACLAFAGVASAATLTVNSKTDSFDGSCTTAKCSLRDAVWQADRNGGSTTIKVPAGLYKLTIPPTGSGDTADPTHGDLDIQGANVTIEGAGSSATIVDGNSLDRIFAVQPGASLTLSGMTLRRGYASSDSSGDSYGGAIYTNGGLTIGNASTGARGDVVFQDNYGPGDYGGAIYADSASTVSLTGASFEDNNAYYGAGIYDDSNNELTLTHDTFRDGTTGDDYGGAIYGGGDGGLSGVYDTFADNNGYDGAGVYWDASAPVSITHSTFDANPAYDYGGAVYDYDSTSMALNYDSFIDNSASDYNGGALYLESQNTAPAYTLNHDLFKGNSTTDGYGAAVDWEDGTLESYDSTYLDNGSYGGALYADSGDSMTLVNDTFSHNGGPDSYAGAIYVDATTPASLVNDTITDNVGYSGDGAIYDTSDLTKANYTGPEGPSLAGIRNTVIADNTGGDCDSAFTSSFDNGYNMDSDGSCFSSNGTPTGTPVQPTDKVGAEPGLGQPADNGGPTVGNTSDGSGQVLLTDAEKAGGPTVDKGTNSGCPSTDARGVARPQGASCDIGAFELAAAPLAVSLSAPSSVRTGQAFEYLITVKNPGPGYSTGTVVHDTVPAGTKVWGATSSTGGPCYASGTTVACLVGDIAPSGTATVYIAVSETRTGTATDKASVGNGQGASASTSRKTKVVRAATAGTSPKATTGTATSVKKSSATLHGRVSPGGERTSWFFEYRTSHGGMWSVTPLGSTTRSMSVSLKVSHLKAHKAYSYRLVAVNGVGTSYGSTRTFHTKKKKK